MTEEQVKLTFALMSSDGSTASAAVSKLVDNVSELYAEIDRGEQPLSKSAQAVKRLADAKTDAASKADLFRQRMTALGYTVNDFTSVSGDMSQRLNAIANNLPALLAGFGGLGLALSGIVPVIGMVVKNWDAINEAFGQAAGFALPKSADALKALDAELKKVNDDLKEFADKEKLGYDELQKFNTLTAKATELEKARNDEAQRRRELQELAGLKSKAERDRAAGFKEAVGELGGGEAVESTLRQALYNIAQRTGQQGVTLESVAKQAEELMRDAARGERVARDTLQRALTQGGFERAERAGREVFERAPETTAAKKAAEDQAKAAAKAKDDAARDAERLRKADEAIAATQEASRERAEAVNARKAEAERQGAAHLEGQRQRQGEQRAAPVATMFEQQTPLGAAAGQAAAGMAQRGASPAEIAEALTPRIVRELRQMAPGMGREQTMDVARKIAQDAARGADAAAVNQQALGTVLQTVDLLGNKVDVLNQNALRLQQMAVQQNVRARTALRRAGN